MECACGAICGECREQDRDSGAIGRGALAARGCGSSAGDLAELGGWFPGRRWGQVESSTDSSHWTVTREKSSANFRKTDWECQNEVL